jgi:hypothetical protein
MCLPLIKNKAQMKSRFLCSLWCIFVLTNASALLVAQSTYKRSYDASNDQQVQWLEVLSDGSAVVAGRSSNGPAGGWDALLVKLDPDGNVEWSKTYGGGGNDEFSAVKSTADGGLMAVGYGGGQFDAYAVKLDAAGGITWQRNYGVGGNDNFINFVEVPGGGYVFSGYASPFVGYLVHTDADGNVVWTRYSGSNCLFGEPIVGAGGDIFFPAAINGDAGIIQIDANGNFVANTRLTGSFNEAFYHIESGGPGYIVSDHSWSFSGNAEMQPWLSGFTTSGNLSWSKVYSINGIDSRAIIEVCPDGTIVFAPFYNSTLQANAILVKTDASGNLTWAKSHPFEGNGKLRHAKPAPGGGFIAAGFVSGGGSDGQDLFVMRTDGDGEVDVACCSSPASVTVQNVTPSIGSSSFSPNTLDDFTTPGGAPTDLNMDAEDRCIGPSCCITEAGTMQPAVFTICLPEHVDFVHLGDQDLDANDLLEFILFTNPANPTGSVLATAATPTFAYNPALFQTGVTYFVAAIAGNNVNGAVDPNDPCFDISNQVQVVWRPKPEVTLSIQPDACEGDCVDVTATFTGTAPFNFVWQWFSGGNPAGGSTPLSTNQNPFVFNVCPPAGTGLFDLCILSLQDQYCAAP